jgi:hypothetical protein
VRPLPPLGIANHTLDFIEAAIGAGRSALDDVAPNLPRAAAMAGSRGSSFYGSAAGGQAGSNGFTLRSGLAGGGWNSWCHGVLGGEGLDCMPVLCFLLRPSSINSDSGALQTVLSREQQQ